MFPDAKSILTLVEFDLALVTSLSCHREFERLVVPPLLLQLDWDDGTPDERYECWQVGASKTGDVLLVHSDRGFGPSFRWGFVHLSEDSPGMDSEWHSGFVDVAIIAGLVSSPRGYQAPGPG